MKTIIARIATVAVLLAFAAAGPAAAQNRIDRLAEALQLTDAQRASVEAAAESADQRSWAVARALQETLTAEQKERLFARARTTTAYRRGLRDGAARRNQVRNDRQGRALRGRAPARDQRRAPAARLDLGDDQRDAVREAAKEHQAAMRELAAARRAGDLTIEEFRSRSNELREKRRQALSEVLSDEQMAAVGERRRAGRRTGVAAPRARRAAPAAPVRGSRQGMREALDLSDEQVELMRIHEAVQTLGRPMRAGRRL